MMTKDKPDWLKERLEYNSRAADAGWPYWRVVLKVDGDWRERVHGEHAPHRAAAKKRVADLLEGVEITEWVDTYIPRDTWDCPNCGVHEGMTEVPNLRGKWDWECLSCSYRTVGHPFEPEEEAGRGSERF